MFRDEEGKSHVVDAYCPHLGANLAVGGKVVGNCIECPFHAWRFRGEDGKCVHIPAADKGENVAADRQLGVYTPQGAENVSEYIPLCTYKGHVGNNV